MPATAHPAHHMGYSRRSKHDPAVLCAAAALAVTTGGSITIPAQVSAEEFPSITTYSEGEVVNRCSVTFLNDTTAATAGHCGPEGAQVHEDAHGTGIGTITQNYLVEGTGSDIALITLDDEFAAPSTTPACHNAPLTTDPVVTNGAFSGEQQGAIVSELTRKDAHALGGTYPSEYVLTNTASQPGDSGAAVLSEDGCVAGILNGGDGQYSAMAPLPAESAAHSAPSAAAPPA